ncbi:two-component sensor kinase [Oryzomicrobium terrae]|uniref:histidine kinase n=1 Tax=Oryzomicrobium terrae TaxID=1735038 RepID=A0A5C1EAW2_9RHOO|nr:two-component sensor kinase [Oryzomicrobium terrae]
MSSALPPFFPPPHPADPAVGGRVAGELPDSYWTSFRYFNLYRLLIAGFLVLYAWASAYQHNPVLGWWISVGYATETLAAVMLGTRIRQRFTLQLTLQVGVDILVMTTLMYLGGGIRTGLGAMLLVSLAAAGLVGEARWVLFYAALATLSLLFGEFMRGVNSEFDAVGFFQAGLLSAGFFTSAISARLVARRVVANEELARRRGIALQNQVRISQRVMEEMQDGVLLVSGGNTVIQYNPRAAELLGLPPGFAGALAGSAPEVFNALAAWRTGGAALLDIRRPGGVVALRVRFVGTDSTSDEALVFLEDLSSLQAQAQQLKLAALGRLTGSIAHEVRNPLAAISHAGELLREERRDALQERLIRIILDNTARIDRIVTDVLQLGRRDRANPEGIELQGFVASLVEELVPAAAVAEGNPDNTLVQAKEGMIRSDVPAGLAITFDRSHLYQVLANLLRNALRHCQRRPGSVLVFATVAEGQIELHILDDGPGIDEAQRIQVFEPFFTTQHQGTGLGLYIARELCEANGARLDLLENNPGAHFRIVARSTTCPLSPPRATNDAPATMSPGSSLSTTSPTSGSSSI